jgi:hypothetical protein
MDAKILRKKTPTPFCTELIGAEIALAHNH